MPVSPGALPPTRVYPRDDLVEVRLPSTAIQSTPIPPPKPCPTWLDGHGTPGYGNDTFLQWPNGTPSTFADTKFHLPELGQEPDATKFEEGWPWTSAARSALNKAGDKLYTIWPSYLDTYFDDSNPLHRLVGRSYGWRVHRYHYPSLEPDTQDLIAWDSVARGQNTHNGGVDTRGLDVVVDKDENIYVRWLWFKGNDSHIVLTFDQYPPEVTDPTIPLWLNTNNVFTIAKFTSDGTLVAKWDYDKEITCPNGGVPWWRSAIPGKLTYNWANDKFYVDTTDTYSTSVSLVGLREWNPNDGTTSDFVFNLLNPAKSNNFPVRPGVTGLPSLEWPSTGWSIAGDGKIWMKLWEGNFEFRDPVMRVAVYDPIDGSFAWTTLSTNALDWVSAPLPAPTGFFHVHSNFSGPYVMQTTLYNVSNDFSNTAYLDCQFPFDRVSNTTLVAVNPGVARLTMYIDWNPDIGFGGIEFLPSYIFDLVSVSPRSGLSSIDGQQTRVRPIQK